METFLNETTKNLTCLDFLVKTSAFDDLQKSDNSQWMKVRKAVKSHTFKSTGSEKLFFRNKELFFGLFFFTKHCQDATNCFCSKGKKKS